MPTAPVAGLVEWLATAGTERGIHFSVPESGAWDFWSYHRLADRSRHVAAGLRAAGVRPGEVVTLVHRGGPDFVAAFFGTLLAGAAPSPLAPPMRFGDPAAHAERITTCVPAAGANLVLCEADLADRLRQLLATAGVAVPVRATVELLAGTAPEPPGDPTPPGASIPAGDPVPSGDTVALVQFTSGSSGRSRGVRISHAALAANIAAIRDWLEMTPGDTTASWLPVHHDMGLIGTLLTPIVNGSDLYQLTPEEFVRRPARYLECFGVHGASLTAMPTFGLDHLTRRVPEAAIRGWELAHWRAVIIGAERVAPRVLDAFTRHLAPAGFRDTALLPAYGLAEATLAVTGVPLREAWRRLHPDPRTLSPGEAVREDGAAAPIAGSGRPLRGVGVSVVDEAGAAVPAGTVGEIVVTGASLGSGYLEPGAATTTGSPSAFTPSGLRTGDAGFLHEGQLYVLGRLGDAMKVRGRTVFAEELEAAIAVAGIPAQRVAVLLGDAHGEPAAVVLLEHPDPRWVELARAAVAARVDGARLSVRAVPRGAIARTTSGKPRRRPMWREFLRTGAGDRAGADRDIDIDLDTDTDIHQRSGQRVATARHAAAAAGRQDSHHD